MGGHGKSPSMLPGSLPGLYRRASGLPDSSEQPLHKSASNGEGFTGSLNDSARDDIDGTIDSELENRYAAGEQARREGVSTSVLTELLDVSGVLSDGANAIVDDSFGRCFTQTQPDPWNWNVYLLPTWAFGVLLRYLVLFPLRAIGLLLGWAIFCILFFPLHLLVPEGDRKSRLEASLVCFLASSFVASWAGVIKYHGPRPIPAVNRVWVSNHTSMIDYCVLCAYSPFAVIMQLHQGWVAFVQTRIVKCLGCLYFNRTEAKDRSLVAKKMMEHVQTPGSTPLLIFPEGTCVNNEYTVMFKRGAFDLGATVCPIAIKYNKIFVDAFWNSRKQSFTAHLIKLMSSWALVCDVWFLEPQTKGPNETPTDFANRVQRMIADQAGLSIMPWDGYLKYYNLAEKHPHLVETRRQVFGKRLKQFLP